MKICPTCKRNYTDDLSFCLDDGARLIGSQPGPNQEKTAVLPGGLGQTETLLNVPRATAGGSTPAYSYPAPQSPEKRGGKLWMIIGGGVAIVFVGLIAVAGLFVWKASNTSKADSSQAASNDPNRNSWDAPANKSSNPNSQTKTAETPDLEWLNGVWTGD